MRKLWSKFKVMFYYIMKYMFKNIKIDVTGIVLTTGMEEKVVWGMENIMTKEEK